MREILFRGKRAIDGKLVYGDYHKFTYTTSGTVLVTTHYIMGRTPIYKAPILVDPTTVGQYTGLTDKKGVKIFKGDILSVENPKPFRATIVCVKFEGGRWTAGVMDLYELPEQWPCTVIGNIHENPELLDEEESKC